MARPHDPFERVVDYTFMLDLHNHKEDVKAQMFKDWEKGDRLLQVFQWLAIALMLIVFVIGVTGGS